MIKIKDVYKKLKNKPILNGITLNINKGEILAIIGRSGCGKSVLLKHMIGIMQPDSGQVFINDEDINQISNNRINELRKKIGMVFQGGALFDSLTVAENISFFLDEHTNLDKEKKLEIVQEKLRQVDLENILDKKPAELSGGMKKRVAIARAIVMEPEIILYDEPTTGLDPQTATGINELIKHLNKELKTTSVIVTHDVDRVTKFADRIVTVENGKIFAK